MTWFLIALICPLAYAFANQTDHYLIQKYMKGGEVGSLIIFSSIFSAIVLPIVYAFHPAAVDVPWQTILILMADQALVVVAVLCYFYALHEDEASSVVSFYQTIPIMAYVLGFFILHESIKLSQGIASIVILIGALILSVESHEGSFRFKKKVVALMLFASFLYAIETVIFKLIAVDIGFWPSLFWGMSGKVVMGILFLGLIPKYRRQFIDMVKSNRPVVLGLNAASESFFIVGEVAGLYAAMLAPVALVLTVNSFQPLFVLILGVVLTLLMPQLKLEKLTKWRIIQKAAGIVLMGLGSLYIG